MGVGEDAETRSGPTEIDIPKASTSNLPTDAVLVADT